MKRLAGWLMGGVMVAAALGCAAEDGCRQVAVPAAVEAKQGELTLADLLAGLSTDNSCKQLRAVAARVTLGMAPQAGSVRVLEGSQIRRLLEGMAQGAVNGIGVRVQVPERIVVERAGATKSCAEIARFVAGAVPPEEMAGASKGWQDGLRCGAVHGIAGDARLELTKTSWNPALQRWEFALRCARVENCVPFLVWAHDEKPRLSQAGLSQGANPLGGNPESAGAERLVKAGETAMLIWDQSGIRVVLPVTCLDGGGLGQLVRARFKNAPRILRAEVVGKAMLRAKL